MFVFATQSFRLNRRRKLNFMLMRALFFRQSGTNRIVNKIPYSRYTCCTFTYGTRGIDFTAKNFKEERRRPCTSTGGVSIQLSEALLAIRAGENMRASSSSSSFWYHMSLHSIFQSTLASGCWPNTGGSIIIWSAPRVLLDYSPTSRGRRVRNVTRRYKTNLECRHASM